MYKRSKDFQWDIRLGLALIVLVLVILNFSSHYTLFRIKSSVEKSLIDQLNEAAVVTANKLHQVKSVNLPDSIINEIKYDYALNDLKIIPLNHKRVMTIQQNEPLDRTLLSLDSSLNAEMLMPLLLNETVYLHKLSSNKAMLLFPMGYAGSKYFIVPVKKSSLLASIEKAGTILAYTAILGVLIIIYAAFKFTRLIIYPFKRLKEKAEKSGRLSGSDNDDEIDQLVSSYEQIIDDLRTKETELVTLNKKISDRAEQLEVYNENILQSMKTGLVTLDCDHKISTINPAALIILGITDKMLIGHPYSEMFYNFGELLELMEKYFATQDNLLNEKICISGHKGNEQYLNVSISHLTNNDGTIIGSSIVFNDETKFIQIQEELELKKRMATLGEMSGGLAHQLKNSIGGIVGFARLIQKKIKDDGQIKQNIDFLLRETTEAELLMNRFLDYARPLEIQNSKINLNHIFADLLTIGREKFQNVDIDIETLKEGIQIFGDSLLLKQAFGNIVDNACQSFKGKAGKVKIRFENVDKYLQIIIADNGPGIPHEYQDKIYAPFFSGSPSGSGLGLPLARKIILLHEGRLEFTSDNNGAIFTISLPLSHFSIELPAYHNGPGRMI